MQRVIARGFSREAIQSMTNQTRWQATAGLLRTLRVPSLNGSGQALAMTALASEWRQSDTIDIEGPPRI